MTERIKSLGQELAGARELLGAQKFIGRKEDDLVLFQEIQKELIKPLRSVLIRCKQSVICRVFLENCSKKQSNAKSFFNDKTPLFLKEGGGYAKLLELLN